MDLAAALTRGIYEQGAEYFKLMIVATGERSVFPNVGPTDARPQARRRLPRGDFSDHRRLSCRRLPHRRGRRAAAGSRTHLGQSHRRANTSCSTPSSPARRAAAIYELYLKKVGELGLPPISFIGHGIGLHLHEDPYLGPTEDRALEAGMVLGIEPLIYETGFGFGMQNKDMVLVTDDGLRAAVGLSRHRQAAGDRVMMMVPIPRCRPRAGGTE